MNEDSWEYNPIKSYNQVLLSLSEAEIIMSVEEDPKELVPAKTTPNRNHSSLSSLVARTRPQAIGNLLSKMENTLNELNELAKRNSARLDSFKTAKNNTFINYFINTLKKLNISGIKIKSLSSLCQSNYMEQSGKAIKKLIPFIRAMKFIFPNNKKKKTPYHEWPLVYTKTKYCKQLLKSTLYIYNEEKTNIEKYSFFRNKQKKRFVEENICYAGKYMILAQKVIKEGGYQYKFFNLNWGKRSFDHILDLSIGQEDSIISEVSSNMLYIIHGHETKQIDLFGPTQKDYQIRQIEIIPFKYNSFYKLKEYEGKLFLLYRHKLDLKFKIGLLDLKAPKPKWHHVHFSEGITHSEKFYFEFNLFNSSNVLIIKLVGRNAYFFKIDFVNNINETSHTMLAWIPTFNIIPIKCNILFIRKHMIRGEMSYSCINYNFLLADKDNFTCIYKKCCELQ